MASCGMTGLRPAGLLSPEQSVCEHGSRLPGLELLAKVTGFPAVCQPEMARAVRRPLASLCTEWVLKKFALIDERLYQRKRF